MLGELYIVVLNNGWTILGNYHIDHKDLTERYCYPCATVRRWGTQNGLGQIARSGPTTDTILDLQPRTEFHMLREVQRIHCDPQNWENVNLMQGGEFIKGTRYIVVLHNGWTIVGDYHRNPENPDERFCDPCAVIRRWGTTVGLGQIAHGGPGPKTILDLQPRTEFHMYREVKRIQCNHTTWQKVKLEMG